MNRDDVIKALECCKANSGVACGAVLTACIAIGKDDEGNGKQN